MLVRALPVLASLLAASGGVAADHAGSTITIAAVGDIAMAPAADGGVGFFPAAIRRALSAEVALGNLEGTLASGGASKCGGGRPRCYAFRAPPSYARLLARAGFTVLSLANNHALDYGRQGRAETIAALRRARLRHTGRPGQIAYLEAGGARVAVLGFAPYPWAQDLRRIGAAVRLVRKAKIRADVVVVTVHAGGEGALRRHVRPGTEWFLGENRGNVVAFAQAVVRAGADLVVGHGPHVLRGLEWYRGRLIAYSLGNFLGNDTLSTAGDNGVGAILRVTLRRDGSWAGGSLIPVRLVSPGLPRLDPTGAAIALARRLSRQDFGRRAVRITPRGRLLPPAWRTG